MKRKGFIFNERKLIIFTYKRRKLLKAVLLLQFKIVNKKSNLRKKREKITEASLLRQSHAYQKLKYKKKGRLD